jgi:hypothetical protein
MGIKLRPVDLMARSTVLFILLILKFLSSWKKIYSLENMTAISEKTYILIHSG